MQLSTSYLVNFVLVSRSLYITLFPQFIERQIIPLGCSTNLNFTVNGKQAECENCGSFFMILNFVKYKLLSFSRHCNRVFFFAWKERRLTAKLIKNISSRLNCRQFFLYQTSIARTGLLRLDRKWMQVKPHTVIRVLHLPYSTIEDDCCYLNKGLKILITPITSLY